MKIMNKEEKNELITAFCGYLPYGVQCCEYNIEYGYHDCVLEAIHMNYFDDGEHCVEGYWENRVENVKPYLRPIDSMTIEELEDYARYKFASDKIWEIVEFRNAWWFLNVRCRNRNNGDMWTFQIKRTSPFEDYKGIEWLNSHFFDYRDLLKKGLALKAPDEMYDFSYSSTGNE